MSFFPTREGAVLPTRGTSKSAGVDVFAFEEVLIEAGKFSLISTGVGINLPDGTYGSIRARSGLAVRHGLFVNAGVIDPDYTGEIKVCLHNAGESDFVVRRGMKIAQIVYEKYDSTSPSWSEGPAESTGRGGSGFGSTG